MPNSAARLKFGTGGASRPGFVLILGLIKLVPRGGRGRLRSGPATGGFRCLGGEALGDRSLSMGTLPSGPYDGSLFPAAGSEGRLSELLCSVERGKVCDLLSGLKNPG